MFPKTTTFQLRLNQHTLPTNWKSRAAENDDVSANAVFKYTHVSWIRSPALARFYWSPETSIHGNLFEKHNRSCSKTLNLNLSDFSFSVMEQSAKFPEEKKEAEEPLPQPQQQQQSGGGWGGWGFSPLSYLSDLQKAAAVAAEEISRNVRKFFSSFTRIWFILMELGFCRGSCWWLSF